MKTELPERSLIIKDRLDKIVKEILFVAKPYIAKIVLFGSCARGDWQAHYSDFDIMIVVKKGQTYDRKNIEVQRKIEEQLELKELSSYPPVTLIFEPIKRINQELEKNQYFFSDIVKEGVLLYDSGEFEFAKARDLSWDERKQISKDYFEDCFSSGDELLYSTRATLRRGKKLKIAAFQLHQATESFYSAILLVFTAYKPKLHDIKKLGQFAADRTKNKELLEIFPRETEEDKRLFQLLKNAYIKARYDPNYKITEEELLYLISRVEMLKEVTEKICEEWINQ